MSGDALRVSAGVRVVKGGGVFTVLDFVDLEHVVLQTAQGQEIVCKVGDLQLLSQQTQDARCGDLSVISSEAWSRAFEVYRHIKQVLTLPRAERAAAIKKSAAVLDMGSSSFYKYLAKYNEKGRISSLLRKGRSDRGRSRIPESVLQIVNACIADHYLTEHRKSVASVWEEIDRACKSANLKTPNHTTVRSIIYRLDPATVEAKRYTRKRADEKFAPLLGAFPNAQFPYAVIQIDHTPMDVIIVDDTHRKPIGRAHLTIGLDVRSKMVTGFVISIDHPGAMATGLCILRSILPKDDWLIERSIPQELSWPCYGFMRTIHTDNAKEFRGSMLKIACEEYGIVRELRPRGQPQYGGNVERAFRTFMKKVHEELPGTTRSSVHDKVDYDSEGKAVMSLAALERWFTVYLLGYYHLRPHKGNDDLAPMEVWKRAHLTGIDGLPPLGLPPPISPEKAERLRLDLLPCFESTVQQYGVRSWSIDWYSNSIRKFIGEKSSDGAARKFMCRFDPSDLSQIWLYDDRLRQYIPLPYRVASRPPVSLWEVRWAKKRLKEEDAPTTNEALIFRCIDLMREIVKEESEHTKSARRKAQRQKQWSKPKKQAREKPPSTDPVEPQTDDEPLVFDGLELLDGFREAE
ncbi:Mu transposase C-terminal domain-containing protein [Acidovorax sp. BLS4]|uniref:Mu transposase C-terminal domain-containing protein n=1 Tax=Acidovorax sp. BLS4 TaxID=3273430 RepID=UPI002943B9CD|nr:Mu transposase C-terminal domain-containing protein [Paracidovorax avenae]WOI46512.1 Mu transposase C-terminal domain-containing protein [Paracidovorax avenae]